MSLSATLSLIVNLFIVSCLGFHVPPAALSTGCHAGCTLEVSPLHRPTPFLPCLQVRGSLSVPVHVVASDLRFEPCLVGLFSCLCWSLWAFDLLVTEESAATVLELQDAPDNGGVTEGQTWTFFVHSSDLVS